MEWIYLTLTAAFLNGLWTALSKKSILRLNPLSFTFIFRGFTTFLLLPLFLFNFSIPTSSAFWLCTIAAGFLEVSRILVLSMGIKEDYFSTYAIYNMAPIFTIIFAPVLLPEKVNIFLASGVIFIVVGALIFYRMGSFSSKGLFCAVTSCFTGIFSKIAIGHSSPHIFMFLAFFLGMLFMSIYSFVFSPLDLKKISRPELFRISKIAFLSMLATVCYYFSIGIAPITRVNPLVRTNLLFGFIFSYFLLKETHEWKRKAAAGVCILFGSVFISMS